MWLLLVDLVVEKGFRRLTASEVQLGLHIELHISEVFLFFWIDLFVFLCNFILISEPKVNVDLARVVDNGYLRFSWSINNKTYLGNKTVQYILSWCPDSSNPPPFVCKKATTFCHATYGGSGTTSGHGEIRKYDKQLKNFPDFIEALKTTQQNASWVTSSWDGTKKQFTCQLWLNPCELGSYHVNIKYQLFFEDGVITDYRKPVFHYGKWRYPFFSLKRMYQL